MTAPTTYASALAACVERWGAPTWAGSTSLHLRSASWVTPDRACAITLYESAGVVWLETAHADDLRASTYPLAGSADMAPVDLTAALDAADAWVAAHGGTR